MKGITAVIATIMLLIIAVAIVGVAYGFLSGVLQAASGKVALVGTVLNCGTEVLDQSTNPPVSAPDSVTITIKNIGTQTLDISPARPVGGALAGDVTFLRFSGTKPPSSGFSGLPLPKNERCSGQPSCYCFNLAAGEYASCPLAPGQTGSIVILDSCAPGTTCSYELKVGNSQFRTLAQCP